MKISEILQSKGATVVTIAPGATVRELVALLKEHNLGAIVVSTSGTDLAGIVSERDVIRSLADGPAVLDQPVSTIMTATVHSCSPGDTVDSLAAMMTERRIRHAPVLDQDALAGIVSIGDVVKSRIGQLEFERDQLQGYVSG
ncbi:MAG: CBS domain-containing protein [Propionibacteriaceae bacterium]